MAMCPLRHKREIETAKVTHTGRKRPRESQLSPQQSYLILVRCGFASSQKHLAGHGRDVQRHPNPSFLMAYSFSLLRFRFAAGALPDEGVPTRARFFMAAECQTSSSLY
jgi:hypothetical protein